MKGPQISIRTDRELNLVLFFVVEGGTEPGPADAPVIVVQKISLDADKLLFAAVQEVLKAHIMRICDLPAETVWTVAKIGGEWAS